MAKCSTSTVLFTPVGNETAVSLGESQVMSLRVADVSPGDQALTRILYINVSKGD